MKRLLKSIGAELLKLARGHYFEPKTWAFWRALIFCFCFCNIFGHWLEGLYCLMMDALFGIVEDNYAIWTDPLIHPYWVYGFGAIGMTLGIEPIKEFIVSHSKSVHGAVLKFYLLAVFLSMLMELGFGLMFNQPDINGVYPFWDNSRLPLNIFGQAWLINDLFIGLVGLLYVWVIFPLACDGFSRLPEEKANKAFFILVGIFLACCAISYAKLIFFIW